MPKLDIHGGFPKDRSFVTSPDPHGSTLVDESPPTEYLSFFGDNTSQQLGMASSEDGSPVSQYTPTHSYDSMMKTQNPRRQYPTPLPPRSQNPTRSANRSHSLPVITLPLNSWVWTVMVIRATFKVDRSSDGSAVVRPWLISAAGYITYDPHHGMALRGGHFNLDALRDYCWIRGQVDRFLNESERWDMVKQSVELYSQSYRTDRQDPIWVSGQSSPESQTARDGGDGSESSGQSSPQRSSDTQEPPEALRDSALILFRDAVQLAVDRARQEAVKQTRLALLSGSPANHNEHLLTGLNSRVTVQSCPPGKAHELPSESTFETQTATLACDSKVGWTGTDGIVRWTTLSERTEMKRGPRRVASYST